MSEQNNQNAVSLTLGIISTIVGALALLAAWIPPASFCATPFAIIGFVLAIGGVVFAALNKSGSIQLPLVGAVLCTIAIVVSMVCAHLAQEALARKKAEAEMAEQKALQAQQATKAAHHAVLYAAKTNHIAQLQATIADLATAITNAQIALFLAQSNYDAALAGYNNYQEQKPYTTNAVYLQLWNQRQALQNKYDSDSRTVANYQGDPNRQHRPGSVAYEEQVYADSAAQEMPTLQTQMDQCDSQMKDLIHNGYVFWNDKRMAANQQLSQATQAFSMASARFESTQTSLNALLA